MNEHIDPNQEGANFDAAAAEAAERVVNDGNPDYLQHHPNAIQDPDKAHSIANFVKGSEETAVSYANKAIDVAEVAAGGQVSDEAKKAIDFHRKHRSYTHGEDATDKDVAELALGEAVGAARHYRREANSEYPRAERAYEQELAEEEEARIRQQEAVKAREAVRDEMDQLKRGVDTTPSES